MTDSQLSSFVSACAQAYTDAYAYHGDLDLSVTTFSTRLQQVVNSHLKPGEESGTACAMLAALHKTDLYLACACAVPTEAAWGRFLSLYRRQIIDLSCYTCGSMEMGEEVADLVLAEMYLPDRQGRSHIAAFDGRIPLGAWLRVIVVHQAYKERKRKCNQSVPLADAPEFLDAQAGVRMDATLRDRRYREVVNRGLRHACRGLSERERLILLLRYEEGLPGSEIAGLLDVVPSTVSRALQSAQQKLKATLLSFLAGEWNGRKSEIDECVTDLLVNPNYSLLTLLKETPKP
jgi:RNA polymerase sigma-70 factor, ECF subfamily